jgi:hypothetical protein
MNLKYSPAGIGTFAGARFKLTKDDFLIGYADFNPILEKFIFVPAQFVPMSEIMQRCQSQRLPDKEFDAAIDRHEREMKAAVLSPEELLFVKNYIKEIPNPDEQRAADEAEQIHVDRQSKDELEGVRDALIREIGRLTDIRDRLRSEVKL